MRQAGPLQRYFERRAAEENAAVAVNPFAAQHGDYGRDQREGKSTILMNRGGTTLDRWENAGLLSETQLAGIAHVQNLWRAIDCGPRLVANLDRTIFGCHSQGHPREIEARHELHRIKEGFPLPYWDVFENVCRHDEPAGTAGSRIANVSRSSAEAARLTVCLISDTIYMRERLSY